MIHPNTCVKFVSEQIGLGVFATAFIPKGTIVYVADPLEIKIDPETWNGLPSSYRGTVEKYVYIDGRGNRVLSWDHGKYVNHCCNPNTLTTGYGFEVAVRDIQPGEEVTDDYGMFNIELPMQCMCGESNCRSLIENTDYNVCTEKWDEKIKDALENFLKVEQLLTPFVAENDREAVIDYCKTGMGYRSVYSQWWDSAQSAVALPTVVDISKAESGASATRRRRSRRQAAS